MYGRSWEELIQEHLWQPLGIASGGFGPPGRRGKIEQPFGHLGILRPGHSVTPGGFWAHLTLPAYAGPAGAAHMTITDWAKFISLHLRGDPANPHQQSALLKSESFATLHQPGPGKGYEGGWFLGTQRWADGHRVGDTGRVFISQGDNYVWHVEAWVAPEIDCAVLIMCNQGGAEDGKPALAACHDALKALIRDFRSE